MNFIPQLRQLIYLLTAMALAACADRDALPGKINAKNKAEIVGGSDLSYGHEMAQHVVSISSEKPNGDPQLCTGTFISEEFILTAKHCLPRFTKNISATFRHKNWKTHFGQTDISITDVFNVTSLDPVVTRQDLGLIRFSGGLPSGARIAKLPLKSTETIVAQLTFLAVGYGYSNSFIKPEAKVKLEAKGKADLKSKAPKEEFVDTGAGDLRAKTLLAQNVNFADDTFSVNQFLNQGGVCFGDSGGPGFTAKKIDDRDPKSKSVFTVIGVASYVHSVAKLNLNDPCKNESVFLNTGFYAPAILNCMALVKNNLPDTAPEEKYRKAINLVSDESGNCAY